MVLQPSTAWTVEWDHNFGQTISWTEAWLSEKSCREARAAKEKKAVCFWAVSLCQYVSMYIHLSSLQSSESSYVSYDQMPKLVFVK